MAGIDLAKDFTRYYTPPLCLFGAIGNGLSVYVFCMTSGHRTLSSSYYLSALAISDIGFLVNLFTVWLADEGYSVLTTHVTCPLVMYLGQVTCFLSVWLVVAFTCERYCAVCYPLTRPTVCTVARAKKVIGVLTIVALLIFSYVWVIATVLPMRIMNEVEEVNDPWVTEEGEYAGDAGKGDYQNESFVNLNGSQLYFLCSVPVEYNEFSWFASNLDSFFTLILPFVAITFLNCRITFCVWKFKGQRETIVAPSTFNSQSTDKRTNVNGRGEEEVGTFSSNSGSNRQLPRLLLNNRSQSSKALTTLSKTVTSSSAAEVRVTKTLLLVSTVFLFLNLPSHAIRFVSFVQRVLVGTTSDHSADVFPYQQWANILFNTNFSVNFLLYCVSGRNFRKSLQNLCTSKNSSSRKIRFGGGTGYDKRQRKGPNPISSKKSKSSECMEMEEETRPCENRTKGQGKYLPKSHEMSFYPSSYQTEVETYYA